MKIAFNQNDLKLSPIDNEFVTDCEGCLFLCTTTLIPGCRLIDFGEEFFERLLRCFNAIFTSESLSDVFKL